MLVLLMGLRCSGKTTLAPLVAKRLACGWSDLDAIVAARLGCATVREAWERHGVSAFRNAETRCLADALHSATTEGKHVLALGGGTPTAPGAAALMQDARTNHRAVTIYLRARPETLQSRLRSGKGGGGDALVDRPTLTGEDPVAEVRHVFMQRDPLYMTLADVVVQVDDLPIEETMLEVQSELIRQGRVTLLA